MSQDGIKVLSLKLRLCEVPSCRFVPTLHLSTAIVEEVVTSRYLGGSTGKTRLIDPDLMSTIKVRTFNAAIGRSGGDFDGQMMSRYDGTNTTGIFRLTFRQILFYNVTNKNKQVLAYPSLPLGAPYTGQKRHEAEKFILTSVGLHPVVN